MPHVYAQSLNIFMVVHNKKHTIFSDSQLKSMAKLVQVLMIFMLFYVVDPSPSQPFSFMNEWYTIYNTKQNGIHAKSSKNFKASLNFEH